MDFFRSILSDDPEPVVPKNTHESEPNFLSHKHQDVSNDPNSDSEHSSSPHDEPNSSSSQPEDGGGGGWSFGGFVKTFSTRSESVLEIYRRDLEEFRSGLKKETELFREVASRAVKDLPGSIEVGASAAHGSLEAVGHTLDGVLKSTAEMMSHSRETLLASSDVELDTPDSHSSRQSFDSLRYSRFDSHLRAIQSDLTTYCEEPDDLDDYNKWKLGFGLEGKSDELKNLIEENEAMKGVYKKIVPSEVDHVTFWSRYFYRFHKLKQQEDVRANLVKRAISIDDDEELTWDVDDDDEETNVASGGNELKIEENKELGNTDSPQIINKENKELGNTDSPQIIDKENKELGSTDSPKKPQTGILKDVVEDGEKPNVVSVEKAIAIEPSRGNIANDKVQASEGRNDELVSKPDEDVPMDKKDGHGESGKDGDGSVVSTKPSVSEEELGWDEIGDLGSIENKISHGETQNRAEVQKRLSTTEEDDEDLSWDIEDDDEPVKGEK
ncbi:hypothetical protein LguiB_030549 [Lonicera macranthoides]